ncbi:5'/3'-nucleotidase SurE [candidate division KSB1 bacterium]
MKNNRSKPKILLSNDDGITAPGIAALYDALSKLGDCIIVAPETERSGTAHGITMRTPIRVREHSLNGKLFGYAVAGTPVDCVKIALNTLLDRPPDLLVSGINPGSNVAVNAIYSGTVAGAAEGGIMNIPAMAVSLASHKFNDYTVAASAAYLIAEKILKFGLPQHTFLNINVPPVGIDEIAGIKITHMCRTYFDDTYEERIDPSRNPYYWLRGEKVILDESADADENALRNKYITVTPLDCDMTNYKALEELNNWELKTNDLE